MRSGGSITRLTSWIDAGTYVKPKPIRVRKLRKTEAAAWKRELRRANTTKAGGRRPSLKLYDAAAKSESVMTERFVETEAYAFLQWA